MHQKRTCVLRKEAIPALVDSDDDDEDELAGMRALYDSSEEAEDEAMPSLMESDYEDEAEIFNISVQLKRMIRTGKYTFATDFIMDGCGLSEHRYEALWKMHIIPALTGDTDIANVVSPGFNSSFDRTRFQLSNTITQPVLMILDTHAKKSRTSQRRAGPTGSSVLWAGSAILSNIRASRELLAARWDQAARNGGAFTYQHPGGEPH
ncbi:hypothetical protein CYMTET_24450 [Cymbomonas tetramitiformis]|uniref:Uncharacterized protein n=1 Tax=Cymbomonas tetramitiformis TaxID=36881 RepID=A0AAE0FX79_9CHLO|nr:hypothetical protein CYMTET_24450 [Cymbomonas tetramitiformis]